jgi:glucose uptake protein GlcU
MWPNLLQQNFAVLVFHEFDSTFKEIVKQIAIIPQIITLNILLFYHHQKLCKEDHRLKSVQVAKKHLATDIEKFA